MSQLHINTPILNNADLDRFVDLVAVKVEARITANQQKRDIQSQITKALTDALAKQNKPTQKPIAEEEDIFANYKIEG
ncbi:hypothetical protein [Aeromonas caviae]|uniref:hypothetical protein n=1 Tax=Aeromonas caviae TaxID=648 RepID=UPI001164DFE8|nr:hypothetical protein [Aeromonas caviae]QDO76413.1 hypothetical protein FCM34_14590 [Aeromonas caviae]